MNKTDVSKFARNVRAGVVRHSPEILTGLGITGMFATTVLAVRSTPKALKAIEDKKDEVCENELTPIQMVQATWKCYIPAATTFIFASACLIGASSVNAKRNAALAAAYKISETAFTEYREKVTDTIGEKKEKTVREKISKDRIEKTPIKSSEVIDTKKGNTLCFDPLSGRYFKSDRDKILKAENEMNRQMLHDINGYVSLNEWYNELGLESIEIGDDMGWTAYNLIKIEFDPALTTEGEPCLAIYYVNPPKYGYDSF